LYPNGSFTPDPAPHDMARHLTAQYGAAVAAFTLDFSVRIALHWATRGAATHRDVPDPM